MTQEVASFPTSSQPSTARPFAPQCESPSTCDKFATGSSTQRWSSLEQPGHSLLTVTQRGYHVYSMLPPEAQRSLHSRTKKRYPLRQFAKQLGVPVSSLWRWLATYLLYQRFPEIAQYQHLGVAHVSIILGVEPECQLYFLRTAETMRWSRRILEGEVRRYHVAREQARREAELRPLITAAVQSAAQQRATVYSPTVYSPTTTSVPQERALPQTTNFRSTSSMLPAGRTSFEGPALQHAC